MPVPNSATPIGKLMFYPSTTPANQGVTSHSGLAERKSERTGILRDSGARREELVLNACSASQDKCHKATSKCIADGEVNRITVLGSRIVAALNSPIQPTVTAPPEHWLPVLRYFLDLTLNF